MEAGDIVPGYSEMLMGEKTSWPGHKKKIKEPAIDAAVRSVH